MTKKIAYLGLFTAAAMILGYVETLLPVFVGVPGIKLGLANLAVVFVLYCFGWREAALVSMARVLAVGFLFGNMMSILYSMAGAALSLLVMAVLRRQRGFSMVGVSMAGGVSHNVGQLLVAMAVVENFSLAYYLPALLISGVITGFLIGVAAGEVYKRIGPQFRPRS